jgi:hypothetical protein
MQENFFFKISFFVGILKVNDETRMIRIRIRIRIHTAMSWIRYTAPRETEGEREVRELGSTYSNIDSRVAT